MENKFYRIGHRLIIALLVSLFMCSTLLFFGPLNLYIRENENLWFSFDSILKPVILISSAAFIITTIVCTLAPKQILHKIACALVFGTGLALYLQGNFFNTKYGSGVLDGSEIVWADYTTYGAFDCALWAACIALPFALIMVFRRRWRAILMTASVALVLVQSFTLTSSYMLNKENLSKSTCEVQDKGMYELSEKDNTLVFMLDSFDQQYLEDLMENDKGMKDKLEGFTEYTNALSGGARRIEAFSSAILGNPFKKDTTFNNYIDNQWEGRTAYTLLHENGVDTRIFADRTYFGGDAADLIANVVKSDEEEGANDSIVKTIYRYTMFEYSQHYLKQYFWLDASVFDIYQSESSYERDDCDLYTKFKNSGFKYVDTYDNAVRIYSMEGASEPFTLTASGERSHKTTSLSDQTKGCFKIIFDMIDDLKENEKFDNATIIIMGSSGDIDKAQHPMLLVKRKNASGVLKENTAPVSLTDLPNTLASLVTTDYRDIGTGKTFFNVFENSERTRYFYLNTGVNASTRIEEYQLNGNIDDEEKFIQTNVFFTNNGVAEKYELGSLLSFKMDATANVYCKEGFRGTTGWRTPLAGPKCIMEIPVKSIPKDAVDVHVYFDVNAIEYYSNFSIYANGEKVYSRKASKSMLTHGINFTVPTENIDKDNIIKLEFDFDNIKKSELDKTIYDRTITLSMESFKIYTQ